MRNEKRIEALNSHTLCKYRVELPYKLIKGLNILYLLKSVVITEEYNVMGNSEELIRTTEYLTL